MTEEQENKYVVRDPPYRIGELGSDLWAGLRSKIKDLAIAGVIGLAGVCMIAWGDYEESYYSRINAAEQITKPVESQLTKIGKELYLQEIEKVGERNAANAAKGGLICFLGAGIATMGATKLAFTLMEKNNGFSP